MEKQKQKKTNKQTNKQQQQQQTVSLKVGHLFESFVGNWKRESCIYHDHEMMQVFACYLCSVDKSTLILLDIIPLNKLNLSMEIFKKRHPICLIFIYQYSELAWKVEFDQNEYKQAYDRSNGSQKYPLNLSLKATFSC